MRSTGAPRKVCAAQPVESHVALCPLPLPPHLRLPQERSLHRHCRPVQQHASVFSASLAASLADYCAASLAASFPNQQGQEDSQDTAATIRRRPSRPWPAKARGRRVRRGCCCSPCTCLLLFAVESAKGSRGQGGRFLSWFAFSARRAPPTVVFLTAVI